MKWNASGFASIVAIACFVFWSANSADAGFQSLYLLPGTNSPIIDYNSTIHEDGTATIEVGETWRNDHGTMYSFDVFGTTDGVDPPVHIIKEVTNGTSLTWVGYKLDLDPLGDDTFELSSPAPFSDVMTLTSDLASFRLAKPRRTRRGSDV